MKVPESSRSSREVPAKFPRSSREVPGTEVPTEVPGTSYLIGKFRG